MSNIKESNKVELFKFNRVSNYLIKVLSYAGKIDKFESEENVKELQDTSAFNAAALLEFIYFKILEQDNEDESAVISRNDIIFELGYCSSAITKSINKLKEFNLIKIERINSMDGVNIFTIDFDKWNELEKKGREIYNNQKKKYVEYQRKKREESVEKIKANLNRKCWTSEKTKNIQEMAYDEVTKEDIHNTGLRLEERVIIQFISKGYFKYTGEIIEWNNITFNNLRYHLIGAKKSEYINNEDEYYKMLCWKAKPQKLIDIAKLLASKDFEKITWCDSPIMGFRISHAAMRVDNITEKLYGKPISKYYEDFNYEDFENKEYYMKRVDISKVNIEKNPLDEKFNNMRIEEKDLYDPDMLEV